MPKSLGKNLLCWRENTMIGQIPTGKIPGIGSETVFYLPPV